MSVHGFGRLRAPHRRKLVADLLAVLQYLSPPRRTDLIQLLELLKLGSDLKEYSLPSETKAKRKQVFTAFHAKKEQCFRHAHELSIRIREVEGRYGLWPGRETH